MRKILSFFIFSVFLSILFWIGGSAVCVSVGSEDLNLSVSNKDNVKMIIHINNGTTLKVLNDTTDIGCGNWYKVVDESGKFYTYYSEWKNRITVVVPHHTYTYIGCLARLCDKRDAVLNRDGKVFNDFVGTEIGTWEYENNSNNESSLFSPPCGNYGDLNQDGKINNQDVNLLMNCIKDHSHNCDNQGDLNQDNKIDEQDVSILEDYFNQRISTFPVCQSSSCPDDFNNDGVVNILDLGIMCDNDHWGKSGITDLNNDGTTDVYDISKLITDWGKRCE